LTHVQRFFPSAPEFWLLNPEFRVDRDISYTCAKALPTRPAKVAWRGASDEQSHPCNPCERKYSILSKNFTRLRSLVLTRQQDLVGIDDEVLSDASQEEDNGVIVSHQCFHTRAKDFSHQWYQHYSRPQPHRNPSHHHLCTQATSAMQKQNTVSSDHLHEKKLVRYVLCPPTSSDQLLIPLKPLPTATIPSITETTTAPEGTNTVACPSIMCHISNHLNLQPANTSRFWVKRPLESPQPPAVWMTSSTKPDVTSMIPSIALLVLRQSCRPQRERCSSLSWPDCATAFGLSGVSSRNRHRRGTQDAIQKREKAKIVTNSGGFFTLTSLTARVKSTKQWSSQKLQTTQCLVRKKERKHRQQHTPSKIISLVARILLSIFYTKKT
jgi:hypothetical protein